MVVDIGTFVKHDPQRFVVGSLANQIRVLLQRMRMRGYQPWKILLSRGLRDALRLELGDQAVYRTHDLGDRFMGLEIKIDASVVEPIILIKPERRDRPLESGRSTAPDVLWRYQRSRA